MAWVFAESDATGNDRLVLLAIADEADDDGTKAFPSIDRLAAKCRIPTRTVRRCLVRLEEAESLRVVRPEQKGRGHHNVYTVLMPEAGQSVLLPADMECIEKGEERGRKGAERGAPIANPSYTHRPIDPESKSTPTGASPPNPRASRLPDEFLLTPEMKAWAATECPHIDVRTETATFCDYWRAESGARARKLDWTATWRNWLRRAEGRRPATNGNGSHPTKQQQTRLNLAAWAAAQEER